MTNGNRVNITNPNNGKTVLRNATVLGSLPQDNGPDLLVVTHRNERFPVALPHAWATPYVPRTRGAVKADPTALAS